MHRSKLQIPYIPATPYMLGCFSQIRLDFRIIFFINWIKLEYGGRGCEALSEKPSEDSTFWFVFQEDVNPFLPSFHWLIIFLFSINLNVGRIWIIIPLFIPYSNLKISSQSATVHVNHTNKNQCGQLPVIDHSSLLFSSLYTSTWSFNANKNESDAINWQKKSIHFSLRPVRAFHKLQNCAIKY